jgi:hypothetical protein
MIRFLLFLVIVLGVGSYGLSHYKNEKIVSEFTKKLDTVEAFSHGAITCEGFVKADCRIENIAYQGIALADSMTLQGIDPLVKFHEGDFISLPLSAKIHNAKFSLFDISNMLKDDIQKELKDFFKKYTSDYDVTIKASFLTDGTTMRDIKILDLQAEDKITPFQLEAKVTQLDTFPILENFHVSFDFSNKRIVFYDFMKDMRKCCKDKFPARYLEMKDGEIWEDMILQTSEVLKLNIKSQFNQDVETDFMKAMLALLQEEKNYLDIQVEAKKQTPLEQTVMMFFIAGPDAVKEVYDIKVKAK